MKVLVFGASGKVGSRIITELLSRKHKVTAVVRNKSDYKRKEQGLNIKVGNALDTKLVKNLTRGHEVVISAIGPKSAGDTMQHVIDAAKSYINALSDIPDVRLFVIGGAASLEVSPGVLLLDTPEFPADWKPVATAHMESLQIYRDSPIIWTYLSPAAFLEPGVRKGSYRKGLDTLITNDKGESRISMEDLAIAVVDELENPVHRRMRFTVAW
jgi:putative NADH-flavin reductase